MAASLKTPLVLTVTAVDHSLSGGQIRLTFKVEDASSPVVVLGSGMTMNFDATAGVQPVRDQLQGMVNKMNKELKDCGRGTASGTAPADSLGSLLNSTFTAA